MIMGFFSKLKKVVAGVDKGAAIAASALPGKAGQIAGDVGQGAGVVTAVVQQIQSKPASELPPEEAQKQATLATAVAVDDHEERIKELEQMIQQLQAKQSGQAGAGHAGTAGQSGASGGS
jgi:16S rRNA C967 or C1407 C5-methylase (RsmB/RsmF family)